MWYYWELNLLINHFVFVQKKNSRLIVSNKPFWYCCFLFFCFSFCANADSFDSLKQQITVVKSDSEQIKLLCKIAGDKSLAKFSSVNHDYQP